MTIASEITRLQTSKSDIKTAIEAKGVSVPSSAKLDTYDDYIMQIEQGGWETGAIFAPGSYTCGAIYTSNGTHGKWYIWDGFNEDKTKYYNISVTAEGTSNTNRDYLYLKTFIKTAGNDPYWGEPSIERFEDYGGGNYWYAELADSRVAYDNEGGILCTILIKKAYGSNASHRNSWYLRGTVNEDLGVLVDEEFAQSGREEAIALLNERTGITAAQSLPPLGLTGCPTAESVDRYHTFRYTFNRNNI